jgi:hypothetical protein
MENWEWKRDILCYKGRIFLFPQSNLKQQISRESHDSSMAGHLGFLKHIKGSKKKLGKER